MSPDIDRSVALVTGGASGIGRATVEGFLNDGWRVMAADLNPASLERLLDETPRSTRPSLATARADVSQEADVAATVATAVERFGRLDAVVNNAGIGGAFGPITELEVEDWDFTFAVLTRGVFLGIKHGARTMQATGRGGSIVNIGSVAGLLGDVGPQAYSAAKAAVVHLSKVAATELAAHRIRVNAVCPGLVPTPLSPLTGFSAEQIEAVQPWPDICSPTDVADVITFLAGPKSGFVTGQVLAVDGGMSGAGPRTGTILGLNSIHLGIVGLNRGTTGERPTVRRGLDATPTA